MRIWGPLCRSAIQWADTGAPAHSSSSIRTKRENASISAPPYARGNVTPTQPRAASLRLKPASKPIHERARRSAGSGGNSALRKAWTSWRNACARAGSSASSNRSISALTITVRWCSRR
ncbi:Uncharacterised protein [Bordetella pertussis]|nr:Uncharacterised protein [Bordetella pertussis]CFW30244.1 Uncharacterised protein [Bordetella pertussis]